jgi:hypothetical protein
MPEEPPPYPYGWYYDETGVDIPPYPYGWYYDENGNLVNGETGETFWDIPYETQDLFYREVLGGVYLSGNLGQDNIEPAIDNLSTEVGRWLDSVELYHWAMAEAKQQWENEVIQNIPPQNTADPITPETHVIAPWDGGGREPTPYTPKLQEESHPAPVAPSPEWPRSGDWYQAFPTNCHSHADPNAGAGTPVPRDRRPSTAFTREFLFRGSNTSETCQSSPPGNTRWERR